MARKTQTPLETRSKDGWLAGKGTEGVSEGCFSLFMFVFGVFILEKLRTITFNPLETSEPTAVQAPWL